MNLTDAEITEALAFCPEDCVCIRRRALLELQTRRKADAVVSVLSDAHRSWCGNCQETIRGEWKFCPECGKRLER